MRSRTLRAWYVATALWSVAELPVIGEQAAVRRTVAAVRLADGDAVDLDGRLDESFWSRVTPAADFIQQDPDNGEPATEKTEVRIAYTQRALYLGVTCFDSEPARWLGYQKRRDEFLQSDDRFMWNIDTFNTQQSGYFFETNPSGMMGDAVRGANFQNRQWDGIWTVRVTRSEIGWTAEIEIPFTTLSFDPDVDSWGINFQRTVRRKNEESLWMGWARNQGLNRLSSSGRLTGVSNISSGLGLELKPYLVASGEQFPGRGDSTVYRDVAIGGDLSYSATPQLRTNLTINTDFAQTEVDQRLTNLTQFPQFYPEKRDFFLDGATFFDWQSSATGDNSLLPYFTRKIGLDATGQPQSIRVGAKVAGQIRRYDVGALYVRAGDNADVPGADYLVARAKRRFWRQSYVGGIYTGRRADGGADVNHTAGVDFLFATSTFLKSENLSVGGFYLQTSSQTDPGDAAAYGVVVDFPNDPWAASLLFREVDGHYNAVVGFTPRTGFRRLHPTLSYTVRPKNHRWLRSVQFGATANTQFDQRTNDTLNVDADLTVFNAATHAQDVFQFHVLPTSERLQRNFTISRGVTLPAGREYRWQRYRIQAASAPRRMLSIAPTFEFGGFYDGHRLRLASDLNVRLRPGVIVYSSVEWNRVDLPGGEFTTRLLRVVPEWQFSPWMSWVNNIQYDTQSSVIGWQSRFRWIVKPGNDIYVVYTHNWIDDPLRPETTTLDRRLASKVLYTKRF